MQIHIQFMQIICYIYLYISILNFNLVCIYENFLLTYDTLNMNIHAHISGSIFCQFIAYYKTVQAYLIKIKSLVLENNLIIFFYCYQYSYIPDLINQPHPTIFLYVIINNFLIQPWPKPLILWYCNAKRYV